MDCTGFANYYSHAFFIFSTEVISFFMDLQQVLFCFVSLNSERIIFLTCHRALESDDPEFETIPLIC